MRGRARRPAVAAAVALLLCLAGQTPGTAQGGGQDEIRPPGVPPPVDLGALPSPAEAGTAPYTVNDPSAVQVGGVQPPRNGCVGATGQGDIPAQPAAQQRLRITEAHEFATGAGQRIAVIDSGINPHDRLAGRLDPGVDYIEGRTPLFDCDGHGTAVAGIIAAAPDPDTGFVGVAPNARVLSMRQGSSFYSVRLRDRATGQEVTRSVAGDTTSMARAIVRSVGLGATVINISEAACFPATTDQVAARDLQAAVRFAADQNVVVVVSAANTSNQCAQNGRDVTTVSAPGWFDEDVLTVGATDSTGDAAEFSIRGPWVDVGAPGTEIVTLDPAGSGLTSRIQQPNGQFDSIAGTSFAAPYVAGVVALVRERYPNLRAREVIDRIEQTAQHTAGPGGRDDALGYGVVDPVAALTDILPSELGTDSEPVAPARLDDLVLPQPEDPLPRQVALIGSGLGVSALLLTMLIAYTVRRYRTRHGGPDAPDQRPG